MDSVGVSREGASMSRFRQIVILALVAGACVGCDQVTKIYCREKLEHRGVFSFCYDTVRLQYAENTGAFLGGGHQLSAWVFIVTGLILVAGMLWYLFVRSKRDVLTTFVISLLIGGAVGNLIDRALYGYVRDFFNLGIGPVRTGIFNVADVAITFGVITLFFVGMRSHDTAAADSDAKASQA